MSTYIYINIYMIYIYLLYMHRMNDAQAIAHHPLTNANVAP